MDIHIEDNPVTDEKECSHGKHCWHTTGIALPVSPMLIQERCCWCGEERYQREGDYQWDGLHGDHRNKFSI